MFRSHLSRHKIRIYRGRKGIAADMSHAPSFVRSCEWRAPRSAGAGTLPWGLDTHTCTVQKGLKLSFVRCAGSTQPQRRRSARSPSPCSHVGHGGAKAQGSDEEEEYVLAKLASVRARQVHRCNVRIVVRPPASLGCSTCSLAHEMHPCISDSRQAHKACHYSCSKPHGLDGGWLLSGCTSCLRHGCRCGCSACSKSCS